MKWRVRGRSRTAFALLAIASTSRAQVTVTEDFTTTTFRDVFATGARWGGGSLTPGTLGGNGVLGDFVASDGRFLGYSGGYNHWEWSTDAQLIPASRTLTGQAITVTNGVFQFASFIVNAGDRVVFTGL